MIKATDLLSAEDELLLAKRAKGGDAQARETLITANLRLAAHLARKKARSGHLNLEDLLSEANLALVLAVDGYDPERLNRATNRAHRFSTYAVSVIDRHLTRVLGEQSGVVTIPQKMSRRVRQLGGTEGQLMTKFGREPTDEEVAGKLRCSLEALGLARGLTAGDTSLSGSGWNTDERADDAWCAVTTAMSDGDGEEDSLAPQLTGEPGSGGTFFNSLQRDDFSEQREWKKELLGRVERALSGLSPRDLAIFWGRNRAGKELAELAREYNLTKARVSQIVTKAREVLRDQFQR